MRRVGGAVVFGGWGAVLKGGRREGVGADVCGRADRVVSWRVRGQRCAVRAAVWRCRLDWHLLRGPCARADLEFRAVRTSAAQLLEAARQGCRRLHAACWRRQECPAGSR